MINDTDGQYCTRCNLPLVSDDYKNDRVINGMHSDCYHKTEPRMVILCMHCHAPVHLIYTQADFDKLMNVELDSLGEEKEKALLDALSPICDDCRNKFKLW